MSKWDRSFYEDGRVGRGKLEESHLAYWRRKWQPTPVFLPRESHGQRSLVGSFDLPVFSVFTQVVLCVGTLFLFMSKYCSSVWIYYVLFIH